MYVLKLTIRNFRCFKAPQVLDFTRHGRHAPPWTILIGNNGAGKTTLLQDIGLALGIGQENDGGFATVMAFGLRGIPRFLTDDHNDRLLDGVAWTSDIDLAGPAEIKLSRHDEIAIRIMAEDVGIPAFAGYGGNRRMAGPVLARRERRRDAILSLIDDNAGLPDAEEWLLQADYADKAQAQPDRVPIFRRAKEIFLRLLPEVDDLRVAWTGGSPATPFLEFRTAYGWVRLRDLSLGYRSMIAWVADFARRLFDHYPDSPDPLAEPAVCLVDEIDLHLHPQWQRQMIGFLSDVFRKTQFIVSTHSPLVGQAVEDANLVLLRREGDQVVIDQNRQAVRGWRLDQILTSDLFGLDSARAPGYAEKLEERRRLRDKGRLTKAEKLRLKDLDALVGDLPVGETAAEREAADLIRRAVAKLKTQQSLS